LSRFHAQAYIVLFRPQHRSKYPDYFRFAVVRDPAWRAIRDYVSGEYRDLPGYYDTPL